MSPHVTYQRIPQWRKCYKIEKLSFEMNVYKRALETLDRTMKDLRNNTRHFGGAMILLTGDFRQTLPVIPRLTLADKINACL